MIRKESRKKQEERMNFILVLLIIILLILIVIIVATKTNKGRMKDAASNITREIIKVDEGIYYQEEMNENVYLLVKSFNNNKITFDLKAVNLYKDTTVELENNYGEATIVDEVGNIKIGLTVSKEYLKIKVLESENVYFDIDEEYVFKR